MRLKFEFFTWACLFLTASSCHGQPQLNRSTPNNRNKNMIGGGCDDCEPMYIQMPDHINSVDTSKGWYEKGQKLLVTGRVFHVDGQTPAPDVVIYYYQTDQTGVYAAEPGMDPRVKTHGRVRGWVKSDKEGKYSIYTTRPAPYPERNTPAHLHVLIKEPDLQNEYYLDDWVFDDDPILTSKMRKAMENRGGSGIFRIVLNDSVQIAEHNIILGRNIPNYPKAKKASVQSGLEIGEDNPSFMPYHAWGPDKGKQVCPVCKYGRYHGIMYFVGNNPNWDEIKKWLVFLEQESIKREKYLKAYFIYGNEKGYSKKERQNELERIGQQLNLKNIALTFVPSMNDTETEAVLNKINPVVENTFVIYRHRNIVDKQINLKPTEKSFQLITKILDQTVSPFFSLPEPGHD